MRGEGEKCMCLEIRVSGDGCACYSCKHRDEGYRLLWLSHGEYCGGRVCEGATWSLATAG